MKMTMKPAEFIALSACTMMLTALGIDIMLPVFAELRHHFGLPPESTATAQIIGFFFMGQIAQLIFGALSDRYGRLAILRIGFPLYIIGGVAAAFAPTLNLMFVARFVAGIGASAVFMTTIAGVRDRFVGDDMARIMSLVFTIFLSTPVFAPFLGMAILSFSSWQWVFLTPPIFAVIVFIWSLRLEESHPVENRSPLRWASLLYSIKQVLGNRVFVRYTAITTMLFIALSSYVASSEHIVGEIYQQPKLFPWIFAGIGLLMSFCTLTNSRLSARFGARQSIRWLLIAYTAVALALFVYTFAVGDPPGMTVFFIAVALLMAINLAVEPNSSALAMEPMGKMAGMASAVYGTVFFAIGASLGAVISNLMVHRVAPIVICFAVIGVLALVLVYTDKRPLVRKARTLKIVLYFCIPLLAACHSPNSKSPLGNIKDDTVTAHRGFHFYVLGDWGRRGKPSQLAVAHQLLAYSKTNPPAFIITTGDNFYQQGVQSTNDPHWTRSFTNIYKELTQEVDWYPTLGNHDYQGDAYPQAQIDYSRINPRWHLPAPYYTKVFTTADSQRVRIVFIDSNPFVALYYSRENYPYLYTQDTATQRKWIDSTLANAKEEWKIVVGHHPVYSGGGEHFNTPELVSGLLPVLNKYKVQLYVCGHEHNLQHLRPTGSYVDYIISGGGGDISTPDSIAGTQYQKATAGFTDIAIRNDTLFLQFIDNGGDIIYQYVRPGNL